MTALRTNRQSKSSVFLALLCAAIAACGPQIQRDPNSPPWQPAPQQHSGDGGSGGTGFDGGAPIPPLTNGDFESGSLTGWVSTGTTSISQHAEHGFYAAQVGGAGEARVNSIAQTFTLPNDAEWLSFWYLPSCTGTVQDGAATATLTDGSGQMQTLLAPTCVENASYLPVHVNVARLGGQTVTLVLSSDGSSASSANPVETLFDEVSITTGYQPPTPECSTSAECPGDEQCLSGFCSVVVPPVAICATDLDCGAWESCFAGICFDVPPPVIEPGPPPGSCNIDSDCGGDQICDGAICVEPSAPPAPSCGSDADCGGGSCSAGSCTDAPPSGGSGDGGGNSGSGGGSGATGCDPNDWTCSSGGAGGGDPGTCDPSDPSCSSGGSGGGDSGGDSGGGDTGGDNGGGGNGGSDEGDVVRAKTHHKLIVAPLRQAPVQAK